MTLDQFLAAVKNASAGERIVYHAGLLARDRERSPSVHAVAEAAWLIAAPRAFRLGGGDDVVDASGLGAGALVQSRKAPDCEYILVMRRPLTALEIAAVRRAARAAVRKAQADANAKLKKLAA